jgi:hypothetical protein
VAPFLVQKLVKYGEKYAIQYNFTRYIAGELLVTEDAGHGANALIESWNIDSSSENFHVQETEIKERFRLNFPPSSP